MNKAFNIFCCILFGVPVGGVLGMAILLILVLPILCILFLFGVPVFELGNRFDMLLKILFKVFCMLGMLAFPYVLYQDYKKGDEENEN